MIRRWVTTKRVALRGWQGPKIVYFEGCKYRCSLGDLGFDPKPLEMFQGSLSIRALQFGCRLDDSWIVKFARTSIKWLWVPSQWSQVFWKDARSSSSLVVAVVAVVLIADFLQRCLESRVLEGHPPISLRFGSVLSLLGLENLPSHEMAMLFKKTSSTLIALQVFLLPPKARGSVSCLKGRSTLKRHALCMLAT